MANGSSVNGTLKTVGSIIAILAFIVGSTLTFANKADKAEVQNCAVALEKKIEKGDQVLHKRIDKTTDRMLRLIEKNQQEILCILKDHNR